MSNISSDFPTRQPAPKIGSNGNWWEWDELTQAYVDTGISASGSTIPDSVRIRKTASGDPAVFSDGADNEPLEDLVVNIAPMQEGSGDPSPNNVRPFVGWNRAIVFVRGENLIDLAALLTSESHEISGGTALHYMTLQLEPNTTYTMSSSYEQTGDKQRIVYFNSTAAAASVNSNNPVTVTTDSTGEAYVFMMDRLGISDFVNGTAWLKLEKGSAATPYSTEYPISFGDDVTIYGGTLNATTGLLTRNLVYRKLSTSVTWYRQSISGAYYFCSAWNRDPLKNYKNMVGCTHFKSNGNSSTIGTNEDLSIRNAYDRTYPINIRYDALTTVSQWNDFITNNNVYVCYETDPVEYQLSQTEIKTLLGTNKISADCGAVEVTYCADASLATKGAFDDIVKREQYAAVRNATMSMFARFGVCGASWDSGYYYKTVSATAEREDVAWGANLARRNGNKFCNYSKADMTTRSYLTNTNCLPKLLADDPCDLYVITLGGNDSSQLGASYLGTIADITGYQSYEDYPDTYYGNYGKIIEQIQAHAPKAKIVLIMRCGSSASELRKAFNAAKDEIAEHYGIPHLNWMDDEWCGSSYFLAMEEHSHPTPATLSGMADAWERLFSKCVNDNQNYFKYYDGSVPSSGGGSVTVDSTLSDSSTNPVQNKVIKAALDGKGTYSKPSGGIPKTDLASTVQISLGKADTALQEHQDISGKAAVTSVPASASVSAAGVLSFANSAGTQLFTVQLPLYAGGVS